MAITLKIKNVKLKSFRCTLNFHERHMAENPSTFRFQSTGSHFLDLASIQLQLDERPAYLFQHLMAFFQDNLLSVHGG